MDERTGVRISASCRTPAFPAVVARAQIEGSQALAHEAVDTTVTREQIASLATKLCDVPNSISVHHQVERILESRLRMSVDEEPMDWGFTETMAGGESGSVCRRNNLRIPKRLPKVSSLRSEAVA